MSKKLLKNLFSSAKIKAAEDTLQESTEMHIPTTEVEGIDASVTDKFMMHASEDGYLTGQLLVATPLIHDGIFQQSVIYMFNHGEEGAMGCIINQPVERVDFASLLEQVNIDTDEGINHEIPVHFGGPVERQRGFVLHSADHGLTDALSVNSGIAVTAVSSILKDIATGVGPKHAALVVGYAGWEAGQLEKEIEENSWITVPATPELVFNTPDEHKWSVASAQLGIDMNFFSHTVGHA